MKILAIETATQICGAAVVEGTKVLAEKLIDEPQIHSEKILSCVDEALKSSVTPLADIDGIAVSIGPGSFTGLRIGLSVVKGLAVATGKPIVPVKTLEALAFQGKRDGFTGPGSLIVPSIDARRNDVYAAGYRGEELLEVIAASAFEIPGLAHLLAPLLAIEQRIILLGDGAPKVQEGLKTGGFQGDCVLPPAGQRRCRPSAVGLLGAGMLAKGLTGDLASLEPLYVKEFFTTMKPLATDGMVQTK